jgi:hypothetical protein
MSKHFELPFALLLALALAACAVDDVGDAVIDTGTAVGIRDVEAPIPEDEFPEVRTNCRLPGAILTRHGTGWRLILPSQIYAARKSEPVAVRIACVTNWARGRGLTLAITKAR